MRNALTNENGSNVYYKCSDDDCPSHHPNDEERMNVQNNKKKNYYGNAFVLQFIKCTNVGSFTYPHI